MFLTKEIFVIDPCLERESQIYPVECTHSTLYGRLHAQEEFANMKWTPCFSCAFDFGKFCLLGFMFGFHLFASIFYFNCFLVRDRNSEKERKYEVE